MDILQSDKLHGDGFFVPHTAPYAHPQATQPFKYLTFPDVAWASDLPATGQGVNPLLGPINSHDLRQFPPIPTSDIFQAGQKEIERYTARKRTGRENIGVILNIGLWFALGTLVSYHLSLIAFQH